LRGVGSPRRPVRRFFNQPHLKLDADEKFILAKHIREGCGAMSRFFNSKIEYSLFKQIALFSVSGLSLSLMAVYAYDLQMAGQWL
jgi:hypothetical protein